MLIILVVVLLLFGGKKIPELMRGLGKGIREFNDAKSSVTKELEEGMKTPDYTSTTTSSNNSSVPGKTPDATNTTVEPSSTTGNSNPPSHTTPSSN